MSYITVAAAIVLVLTPVTIPATVIAAQTVSDRRHMRWVAGRQLCAVPERLDHRREFGSIGDQVDVTSAVQVHGGVR